MGARQVASGRHCDDDHHAKGEGHGETPKLPGLGIDDDGAAVDAHQGIVADQSAMAERARAGFGIGRCPNSQVRLEIGRRNRCTGFIIPRHFAPTATQRFRCS